MENEQQKKEISSYHTQVTALKAKLGGSNANDLDPNSVVNKAASINMLRGRLSEATKEIQDVQQSLDKLLVAAAPTSRAGHLRSLQELIGAPPKRHWTEEWIKLKAESYRLSGQGEATPEDDERYVMENDTIEKYKNQAGIKEDIDVLEEFGWPRERAETYTLLFTCSNALGRALRERDPCYAASIYALSDVLFAQRSGAGREADDRKSFSWGKKDVVKKHVKPPPSLYYHRDGVASLTSADPAWDLLEEADTTGFRGLTSSALVHAHCDPRLFSEDGLLAASVDLEGDGQTVFTPMQSDVICFESNADDEHGAHSPVVTSAMAGDFPPNTLFRLKEIYDPGNWEAPGGHKPMQRLLVVTATYQPPRQGLAANEGGSSKYMATTETTLTYNKREAFTKGLDDLIAKPALLMENEFLRNDTWVDWKGVKYTAREEWAYVNGRAATKPNCTPGTRDEKNDGVAKEAFLERANGFIKQRRAEGHGLMLSEEHALLTMEEVLAVRLYSGPAYQPINTFLRQISSLTASFRATVGQHPGLTYAATVGHICRAIRKLAAVATPEEARAPLFRGVRGNLEKVFWVPDANDMVCAVDMAFMSTSRARMTPINYMASEGSNVLWRLHPQVESDSGFHSGASIDMLSQFAGEEEVMFPPCTMLIVKEEPKLAAAKRAGDVERIKRLEKERGEVHPLYGRFEVKEEKETAAKDDRARQFLQIDVLPIFL